MKEKDTYDKERLEKLPKEIQRQFLKIKRERENKGAK